MAGSCKRDNEPSVCTKRVEFLDTPREA